MRRDGRWGELRDPDDQNSWLPSPGARSLTIKEYLGSAARRVQRYGEWVEISADVARCDATLHQWCRRHANSELPSGAFRLAPMVWAAHSDDELDLPFLPEFDHPDDVIRELAAVEALRRDTTEFLEFLLDERRHVIADATALGYSRRDLGRLLDLSYGRIQQIVAEAQALDDHA